MMRTNGNRTLAPPALSDKQQQRPMKRKSSHVRDAMAGAAAGAFAKTAVAPIERVKLLMQLQSTLESQYRGRSAWQVAHLVYKQQGLYSFWRGNLPNVIMHAGTASLNFMLMDWFKSELVEPIMRYTMQFPSFRTDELRKRRRAMWASFLSGGLAGGTALTLLYPFAFLRTRLALDVGSSAETRLYKGGMRDTARHIFKTDGIKGLYQGYGVALVGGVAYRALHLGGYDAIKTELLRYHKSHGMPSQLSWGERVAAAQFISLTAAVVMYPVDSIRRRLMMQAGIPLNERLYRNSFECVRAVMQKEGLRGFYLGLAPNLIRSVGAALMLVAYDGFKTVL